MEENRRLRGEIEDLREQNRKMPNAKDDEEKLDMYERLEKSESRILSLERQVRMKSLKCVVACGIPQSLYIDLTRYLLISALIFRYCGYRK